MKSSGGCKQLSWACLPLSPHTGPGPRLCYQGTGCSELPVGTLPAQEQSYWASPALGKGTARRWEEGDATPASSLQFRSRWGPVDACSLAVRDEFSHIGRCLQTCCPLVFRLNWAKPHSITEWKESPCAWRRTLRKHPQTFCFPIWHPTPLLIPLTHISLVAEANF